jgi:hypothetical protein
VAEDGYLDWQWDARAEAGDLLGRVGNDDQLGGVLRDDLFAQQGAAHSLDKVQIGIDLVGAVDGDVCLGRARESGDGNA